MKTKEKGSRTTAVVSIVLSVLFYAPGAGQAAGTQTGPGPDITPQQLRCWRDCQWEWTVCSLGKSWIHQPVCKARYDACKANCDLPNGPVITESKPGSGVAPALTLAAWMRPLMDGSAFDSQQKS